MEKIFNIPQSTELVEKNNFDISVHQEQNLNSHDVEFFNNDYNLAKSNLTNLLEKGKVALDNAVAVASQTDDHKAYNTVSALIKTIADINDKLIDLHMKNQKFKQGSEVIENGANSGNGMTINNNTLYLATTSELSNLIKMNLGETINGSTETE